MVETTHLMSYRPAEQIRLAARRSRETRSAALTVRLVLTIPIPRYRELTDRVAKGLHAVTVTVGRESMYVCVIAGYSHEV